MMRKPAQILLLLGTVAGAGCVTHYSTYYPNHEERMVFAITALYETTRSQIVTDGVLRYALVPDADVVESAETMLMHYSRSEVPIVRAAAVRCLAHFGTRSALDHALELAHAETNAEIRAEIWSAIAELLQSPRSWPLPQIQPIAESSEPGEGADLMRVISSQDLGVVISSRQEPADFILPPDVPVEIVESEVLQQYASDTGSWSVTVVDRIPFVPFWARRRTMTLTVRQSIAEILQWSAGGNPRIRAAFREFARDANETISGPAREVIQALDRDTSPVDEAPPQTPR